MECNVRNANQERVLTVMERVLKKGTLSACTCSDCVNRIAAMALNLLPPHYYARAEDAGEIGSPWIIVENAVMEAITVISENPKHQNR